MPIQVFDRINDINVPKLRSMDINKYFGEMSLTKKQKKERIALAEDLEDVMMFFFYLVLLQSQYDYMAGIESLDVKQRLRDKMYETISKHTELNDEMRNHLYDYADEVTRTTTEHLAVLLALMSDRNSDPDKKKSEEYYVSNDRARFLAEEEANTIFNGADYYKAKKLGYTKKEWVSMRDRKVRRTHEIADGTKIPIDDVFYVGNSCFRFCRDTYYSPSPKETVGCRCVTKYYK